jgi:hypothetical protein
MPNQLMDDFQDLSGALQGAKGSRSRRVLGRRVYNWSPMQEALYGSGAIYGELQGPPPNMQRTSDNSGLSAALQGAAGLAEGRRQSKESAADRELELELAKLRGQVAPEDRLAGIISALTPGQLFTNDYESAAAKAYFMEHPDADVFDLLIAGLNAKPPEKKKFNLKDFLLPKPDPPGYSPSGATSLPEFTRGSYAY